MLIMYAHTQTHTKHTQTHMNNYAYLGARECVHEFKIYMRCCVCVCDNKVNIQTYLGKFQRNEAE